MYRSEQNDLAQTQAANKASLPAELDLYGVPRKWDSRGGSLSLRLQNHGKDARGGSGTHLMTQNNNFQWYAIRVKSQHEDLVSRHLRVRGLEAFLPLCKRKQRWSDRFKEIDQPLFPGYVFCQFDQNNRLPVLTVPGVVHVVGVGKNPIAIEESEIAAIRIAVKSGLARQPWPYLEVGQRVRIENGPLCEMEGILIGFRGNHRLVLSITLLQRSIAVEIDEEWVRPMLQKHDSPRRLSASQHSSQ